MFHLTLKVYWAFTLKNREKLYKSNSAPYPKRSFVKWYYPSKLYLG
jgi:hypothetical protein